MDADNSNLELVDCLGPKKVYKVISMFIATTH